MKITDFDFEKISHKVIDHKYDNSSKRETKLSSIKPSGITYCLRKQWFDNFHRSKAEYKTQIGLFDFGNLIHDDYVHPILQYWIKNIVKDENIVIVNEYRLRHYVTDNDIISGYVDNLIIIQEKNQFRYVPIEVKSIADFSFKKLRQPKSAHIAQVVMYMWCFDSDYGIVTYHSKSDLRSKTFIVYRNEEEYDALTKIERKRAVYVNVGKLADILVKRGVLLNGYKRNGIVPPAEMRISNEDNKQLYSPHHLEVISNKEEYADENYGKECTDTWQDGSPRCESYDACMAMGVGEQE